MNIVESGSAPNYTMDTDYGQLQPVYAIDVLVFCPAEGWKEITKGGRMFGYYPAFCPANGLMHTGYPDPVTRRRMREKFNRLP